MKIENNDKQSKFILHKTKADSLLCKKKRWTFSLLQEAKVSARQVQQIKCSTASKVEVDGSRGFKTKVLLLGVG
jgi:hypothetical protein